ncbi:uncharacterized protein EURHEDRAFT_406876 [Aspergillus ruber CBS 135680]|uniref:Uncharacterized protein n=1 Tax=Aspergillus ruber (strain CBS 135680) TaxID=1388766 RepID=A0A017S2N6_ASPRC|nr:uncharacterized protein EURHEDRAFT_406876 [Aspergillus ruber CBS 135680]EYE90435.1 hypothetical protein EURHEDRAFT_406876 [Aspergillus ruber CBS 135680]
MTHSRTSLNLEYPSTRNILYSEQDVMITVIYLDEAWSETGLYVFERRICGSPKLGSVVYESLHVPYYNMSSQPSAPHNDQAPREGTNTGTLPVADIFPEKQFCLAGIIVGYCVAVVATIELYMSYMVDLDQRPEKKNVSNSALMLSKIWRSSRHIYRRCGTIFIGWRIQLPFFTSYHSRESKVDLSLFCEFPAFSRAHSGALLGRTLSHGLWHPQTGGELSSLNVPSSVTRVEQAVPHQNHLQHRNQFSPTCTPVPAQSSAPQSSSNDTTIDDHFVDVLNLSSAQFFGQELFSLEGLSHIR